MKRTSRATAISLGLATAACLSDGEYADLRMRDPFGWAANQCDFAAEERVGRFGGDNPDAHGEFVDQVGKSYSFRGKVEYGAADRRAGKQWVSFYCVVRDGEVLELDLGNP